MFAGGEPHHVPCAGAPPRGTDHGKAGGPCARSPDTVAKVRSDNRSARIQVLVAEQAARRGARVLGVVDVCTAAVAALPVGGAGLSAMSRSAASHPLCSTDDVSEQLEELQLTLGEGPCVDAFTQGSAVLMPDLLAAEVQDRWLCSPTRPWKPGPRRLRLPSAHGRDQPRSFSDPYSQVPGRLNAEALADALAFADTAALVLLTPGSTARRTWPGGWSADGRYEDLGAYRAEIDQATGMLTARAWSRCRRSLRPPARLRLRQRTPSCRGGRRRGRPPAHAPQARKRIGPTMRPGTFAEPRSRTRNRTKKPSQGTERRNLTNTRVARPVPSSGPGSVSTEGCAR